MIFPAIIIGVFLFFLAILMIIKLVTYPRYEIHYHRNSTILSILSSILFMMGLIFIIGSVANAK